MTTTAHFYNRISILYPIIDIFLHPYKKKLIREINSLPTGDLLEIGVGMGKHLSSYKHCVIGIDNAANMIKTARNNASVETQLFEMDAKNLTFENSSFDYVVLIHTLSTIENYQQVLNESKRVLRPNGKLLIFNHITPNNFLKFADYAFNPIARLLHFQSYFKLETLTAYGLFKIEKAIKFGVLKYYQLIILKKA